MKDGPQDPNDMPLPHGERTSFADHEEPSGGGPSTMDCVRVTYAGRETANERLTRALREVVRTDVKEAEDEHPHLVARLRHIESKLDRVLLMNNRELAVLKRIDDATTALGAASAEIADNLNTIAAELKKIDTGDSELDAALEAKATVLEKQAADLQTNADALVALATPADGTTGAAELLSTPTTGA